MEKIYFEEYLAEVLSAIQIKGFGVKETRSFIDELLLPELDKKYSAVKKFLKNSIRADYYNIRKHLIDLTEKDKNIQVSRLKRNDPESMYGPYEAIYAIVNVLNAIYFYTIILSKKVPGTPDNLQLHSIFSALLREIKGLQVKLLFDVEKRRDFGEQ